MDRPPLRRELAAAFRDRLAAWAERPLLQPDLWAARCPQLSRTVHLETWEGRTIQGIVRGFDARGGLILAGQGRDADSTYLPGEVLKVRLADPAPSPGEPA
jgi:biotin-(acetyl-CoA carboxylase) ligase